MSAARALLGHPALLEALLSAAILSVSILAAQLVGKLIGVWARRAERDGIGADDRLLHALRRPVAYAVFLTGAWTAVHRLPLAAPWMARLDSVLFVIGVFLAALALGRAYTILLGWYRARPQADLDLSREFVPLALNLGRVFIGVLAVITVLQHFGVNVASLVVSLGVGSLAVGLAAQDTLSNMFAGFTLMLDRPFRVGERIQLATGEVGDVEAIGIRATLLRTVDETVLVVPNALLVKERIVNVSRAPRGLTTRLPVAVSYGSDLERVSGILREAARAVEGVDGEREPVVNVTRFGEWAVHFLVVFWVRDYTRQASATSAVHAEVYRRLREAGIELAVPVSRVMHQGGAGGQG